MQANNDIFYDELCFINNSLKHSFFYRGLTRGFKLPNQMVGRQFTVNVEPYILPPRFFHQFNNICFNYLKKHLCVEPSNMINTIDGQLIQLNRSPLSRSFSPDKFRLVNFSRANLFSKRNRMFYFHLNDRIKRRWLLTIFGLKKKVFRA